MVARPFSLNNSHVHKTLNFMFSQFPFPAVSPHFGPRLPMSTRAGILDPGHWWIRAIGGPGPTVASTAALPWIHTGPGVRGAGRGVWGAVCGARGAGGLRESLGPRVSTHPHTHPRSLPRAAGGQFQTALPAVLQPCIDLCKPCIGLPRPL